jgi:hypothetical protein
MSERVPPTDRADAAPEGEPRTEPARTGAEPASTVAEPANSRADAAPAPARGVVDVDGEAASAPTEPKKKERKKVAPKMPNAPAANASAGSRAGSADATTAASTAGAPASGAPPEITVVVPIETGDGRVRDLAAAFGSELGRMGRKHEILFVFDGVRGAAWREAEELAAAEPDVVVPIALQQHFGESVCLSVAFERARGKILVTSPQYVQIDPYEITRMLQAIDSGADFVTPWRHPRVDPFLNRVQSAAFNWVMRKILAMPFHDLNCYYRAFRREVLEEVAVYGDQYRFLPAIAKRQGFDVVELRVRHLQEWGGSAFFGLGVYVRRFLDILGVVFLAKFTLKPLRFFGTLGGIFLLVGLALSAYVAIRGWGFGGGAVLSSNLFLFGFLLCVLGVQVIGFGLVGEIIIYTQARNLREYRIERIHE